MKNNNLTEILNKAEKDFPLSFSEIFFLLALEDDKSIQQVMSSARRLRDRYFGNKMFLYGFIYFSTFCRNQCAFCYYRNKNGHSPRYRKKVEEVSEIAEKLADSGVHLIDLTMGEDPLTHDRDDFSVLFQMIDRIKRKTGLPLMISPGVVPDQTLRQFASLETDWHALYQETHNPTLFNQLRIGQSFEIRAAKRAAASRQGMLVEDGILLGVGETVYDRAQSIVNMRNNNVDQARMMSFVPQTQTPFAELPSPPRFIECLGLAVSRLVMPDRLLPASLDVDGIKGLTMRLEAGANVITSIIPPMNNLAGVSQSSLDIEQGLRTVSEVEKVLVQLKLQPASIEEYRLWMAARKKKRAETEVCRDEDRYRRRTPSGPGIVVSGAGGRV